MWFRKKCDVNSGQPEKQNFISHKHKKKLVNQIHKEKKLKIL